MGGCSSCRCRTCAPASSCRTAPRVCHLSLRPVLIPCMRAPPAVSFLLLCTPALNVPIIERLGLSAATPGLLIGPENSLLCFDSRTGLQKWATGFDVPLVAAYPSGGCQNILAGALHSPARASRHCAASVPCCCSNSQHSPISCPRSRSLCCVSHDHRGCPGARLGAGCTE